MQGLPSTWWWPLGLLMITVVVVPIQIFDDKGIHRYRELDRELRKTERQNELLRSEIRDLRVEVEALRNNPQAMERIARDELGMVREGEIVFQIADD